MIIIKHRVNTIKEVKKIDNKFGIEIDLRSNKSKIYLHHDPLKKGEEFSKWIKFYNHRLLILNVKEEGLEKKILSTLKKYKINNYFFHDQTFSSMLKNMKSAKVSVRYSEYEKLDNKNFYLNTLNGFGLITSLKYLKIKNFINS